MDDIFEDEDWDDIVFEDIFKVTSVLDFPDGEEGEFITHVFCKSEFYGLVLSWSLSDGMYPLAVDEKLHLLMCKDTAGVNIDEFEHATFGVVYAVERELDEYEFGGETVLSLNFGDHAMDIVSVGDLLKDIQKDSHFFFLIKKLPN